MGCASSAPERDASARDISLVRDDALDSAPATRTFVGAHDDMCNGVAAGLAAGEWLSAGEDKTIAVTDWHAGKVVHTWRGHEKAVSRVLPVPQVNGALSCSRDATVRLWKRSDAAPTATLTGHELSVTAIALADDGGVVVSGSRDYSVRVWDLASATCTTRCKVSRNVVTCLSWVAGEAHMVAQGSEDLSLRVWDVRTLSQPAALMDGYVYFPLCCASRGPYVATGSNGFDATGCEVRLWDWRTLKPVHELRGHQQAVTGIAMLPSPRGASSSAAAASAPLLAATGSKDGQVRLWDLSGSNGACLAELQLPPGSGVTGVAAARDDDEEAQLYVSTASGHVHAVATSAKDGSTPELRIVATGGGPADEHM